MKIYQKRLLVSLVTPLTICLGFLVERIFLTDILARDIVLFAIGFGIVSNIIITPAFGRRFVDHATAESLAAIRIITCIALLVMTLGIEDVSSTALLPASMRISMGVMNYFYAIPGFESFVRSQTSLQVFEWITALVLFLGVIGWRTRVVIPIAAMCYLLLGGIVRHYAWYTHTGLLPTYVLAVLSFTPCGDALSVDRLLRSSHEERVLDPQRPTAAYGWSRFACWAVMAIPYAAAGFSKLRKSGFKWVDPVNMQAWIYETNLDPMQFDWRIA